MKKVLASVVFIGICCILFLPLPAVMASEGRLGVFFATRDLEGLKIFKKTPSEASVEGYGGEYVVVDREDSFWHIPFRHCFLVLGRQVLEATDKLLIEVVSARGISRIIKDGKLMKETKDGDETEWLFDPEERRKFTISCIPFVLEGDTIIKNGSHADVTKDDVEEIWNRCYSAFKSRVKTKNKYHGIWNNCCTSAFESVKQVADESEDFDLKPNLRRINIRDYNLLGVGIPLHDTNDLLIGLCDNPCVAHDKHPDACDIQKGLSRVLSDITLSNILKFVGVYNVRNVQLEEYRDRLISIENCILQYEFSFQCCGRYFGVIRGDAELEAAQALHVAINSTEYGGHQYYGMSKDEILRLIRRTHAKQLFVKADELHRRRG